MTENVILFIDTAANLNQFHLRSLHKSILIHYKMSIGKSFLRKPADCAETLLHFEQRFGDSGKKQLSFNRKKPPAELGTGSRLPRLVLVRGQERDTNQHSSTGAGVDSNLLCVCF